MSVDTSKVASTNATTPAIAKKPSRLGGAATWVVPNPSGLNAHHQLPDLARIYGQLRADDLAG